MTKEQFSEKLIELMPEFTVAISEELNRDPLYIFISKDLNTLVASFSFAGTFIYNVHVEGSVNEIFKIVNTATELLKKEK